MRTEKIKVAIDTTYMDRRSSMGTAIFIRGLVDNLAPFADDLDITLVHREPIPEDPIYKTYHEIIISKISFPKGSRLISELFFFLTTRKRFDVYYFAYSKLPPYFFLAPARHIISMQYDGGPETAGVDLGGTTGKIRTWMLPLMRRFVDVFIATSEFGKRGLADFRGLPQKNIRVLYGGAESIFRPIPKDEAWEYITKEYDIKRTPLIVASGRLDPHKNILRLVEAYDILKKHYKIPHKLIITGGAHMPDYSARVFKLIEEKGLQEDCTVLRVREFHEIPYFYAAADAMVFPSLYEGFGLPLAEAMHCGVPTVASRGTSLIEVGGDATEFFDPLNPEDMARAIDKVLMDPTYQAALVARGFEQAKKFTWEKHAEAAVDIFREVAGRS